MEHTLGSRGHRRYEDPIIANTPDPSASHTIVLIHGLWVTPRS